MGFLKIIAFFITIKLHKEALFLVGNLLDGYIISVSILALYVPSLHHFLLYSDATVVMNCTFSRYVWGMQHPDFTFCMFIQTMFGMDSFNWQLGSADTSTPNTGPSEDHSGTGIGESNVPTMQYLNGIPRNTTMKTYMLSLD